METKKIKYDNQIESYIFVPTLKTISGTKFVFDLWRHQEIHPELIKMRKSNSYMDTGKFVKVLNDKK